MMNDWNFCHFHLSYIYENQKTTTKQARKKMIKNNQIYSNVCNEIRQQHYQIHRILALLIILATVIDIGKRIDD